VIPFEGFTFQPFGTSLVKCFPFHQPSQKRKTTTENLKMNPLIKTTVVVTIIGSFAGTAFAGPGDAYAPFGNRIAANKTESVGIALLRTQGQTSHCPSTSKCPSASGCSMKTKMVVIPSANPKTHTSRAVQVTACE